MRRASRVYLTYANAGKVAALKASLLLYVNYPKYRDLLLSAHFKTKVIGMKTAGYLDLSLRGAAT
ncbi:MAG: hypothetical protein J2P52_14555 [Blastocatellia bacterium]|nr:hypothetical protein [Blastocatellia bacterium]